MQEHSHNKRQWDQLVGDKNRFTRPATDDQFDDPLRALDSRGWLGASVRGKRILCLAAAGGKQGPLLAAAGADVTVVDISAEMLALDREVASERKLRLRTVEGSMDDLGFLDPASFDIVSQPVSSCYVPSIRTVYHEVARVVVTGGLYVSQHKQPACLQAEAKVFQNGYLVREPYYRSDPLPNVPGVLHREEGTLEYLHRWEEMLGGLCQAGFVIEDFVEPCHSKPDLAPGTFGHRSSYFPPFLRIKARRSGPARSELWAP